jgi:cobalt-zinc-cadmium efflux system outer membrane protein
VTYGYKRTQLPDTTDSVNTAIASVRITLPFTDKNQGNRAAAEADLRRAGQQLAAVEADARAEYYGAVQEYQMRQKEFETMLQPLREHAGTIAQIASAAYAEGGTDLLRLLDAERARLDAELAWTRGFALVDALPRTHSERMSDTITTSTGDQGLGRTVNQTNTGRRRL